MSWLHHSGSRRVRVEGIPAVAAHLGRLWIMWRCSLGRMRCIVTTDAAVEKDGQICGSPTDFPHPGLPVIASVNGELHAIVLQNCIEVRHYRYNDAGDDWKELESKPPRVFTLDWAPAMTAFRNGLFLVWVRGWQMYYSVYSVFTKEWTYPSPIEVEGQPHFNGVPTVFVINGVLHLLCTATGISDCKILGFRYDDKASVWIPCDEFSQGCAAASTVSATSYGGKVYLGLCFSGDSSRTLTVAVCSAAERKWQQWRHWWLTGLEGASDLDPSRIAVLNGRVHIIFNDGTPERSLHWFSRSIFEGYSPGSWMASLADNRLLSAMTIPGTHDSCARSNIPYVRTQYLSITQQLVLGIRFFDLRLRRHGDGKLYCYHGGVALGFPKRLTFEAVMDEIWAFIRPERSEEPPTETVLISINNDDSSKEQELQPEVFYDAVAEAITNAPPFPDGTGRWFLEPITARLGDVRGKAVLLRRYRGNPKVEPRQRHGLDLSAWRNDNPNFTIVTPTRVTVRLQDKWKYADRVALGDLVDNKSGHVNRLMGFANSNLFNDTLNQQDVHSDGEDTDYVKIEWAPETWFLNFCSAVGDPTTHGEVAEAKWIAVGAHSGPFGRGEWIDGMNMRTRNYIQQQESCGKKRFGIIILDYPELPEDNDLVARLIESNFSERSDEDGHDVEDVQCCVE